MFQPWKWGIVLAAVRNDIPRNLQSIPIRIYLGLKTGGRMIAFAVNIIVMIVIIRSNNFIPYLQFSAPAIEARIGTSYYFLLPSSFIQCCSIYEYNNYTCFCPVISNQFKTSDNLDSLTNFCLANKHCLFIDTLDCSIFKDVSQ